VSHSRLLLLAAQIVTYFAQTEQNMNAVERITVYAELPPEGIQTTPNDPPPSWPSKGAITFRDVGLAYREGLPLVLKDVNFDIKPSEKVSRWSLKVVSCDLFFTICAKVGIVGRTGAGTERFDYVLVLRWSKRAQAKALYCKRYSG
jgi:ABC-type multidrug transport system fused ATPase/permease subunit